MITAPVSSPSLAPPAWVRALARRGFAAAGNTYRLNGFAASAAETWLLLEAAAPAKWPGYSQAELSRPCLWKRVGRGENGRLLFEFPAAVLLSGGAEEDLGEAGLVSPEGLLDWALASAKGEIPPGWRPPASALVASWLPQGALTVRVGPLVRQGELLLAPDRWALRFPILPCEPAELPEERRLALELLAADAQDRQRMIRVGLSRDGDSAGLLATLDLTGAPHSEHLFLAGLDGLTQAVAWLCETGDLLADITLTSRLLAVHRLHTKKTERKHHDSYH